MKYIVVDFEMNPVSREYREQRDICKNEIIEIGAVLLDENYTECDSFQMYVRPCYANGLEKRIVRLTGITDEMLLGRMDFHQAIRAFFEWCHNAGDDVQIVQWSENDYYQVTHEILQKGYLPSEKEEKLLGCWHDFQEEYVCTIGLMHRTTLTSAVMLAGEDFEGRHHDALYDARNTAGIFRKVRIPEEKERSLGVVIDALKEKPLVSSLGEMFDFSKILAVA